MRFRWGSTILASQSREDRQWSSSCYEDTQTDETIIMQNIKVKGYRIEITIPISSRCRNRKSSIASCRHIYYYQVHRSRRVNTCRLHGSIIVILRDVRHPAPIRPEWAPSCLLSTNNHGLRPPNLLRTPAMLVPTWCRRAVGGPWSPRSLWIRRRLCPPNLVSAHLPFQCGSGSGSSLTAHVAVESQLWRVPASSDGLDIGSTMDYSTMEWGETGRDTHDGHHREGRGKEGHKARTAERFQINL
jgi:hypothetical protein